MDLIDRSKLHSVSVVDSINSEGVVTVRSFWNSDVANAPTVEAIPIEWIRQWHGIDDIKDYDLREYVKCTILYMLKEWKKENGN